METKERTEKKKKGRMRKKQDISESLRNELCGKKREASE